MTKTLREITYYKKEIAYNQLKTGERACQLLFTLVVSTNFIFIGAIHITGARKF